MTKSKENLETKQYFITVLKKQVNPDQTPRFTDEEIAEMANEHFGE